MTGAACLSQEYTVAWYCFLFEQNQGFNCRGFFFHYLLIDKSCSQDCETSRIVSGLPGFSSSSLRTRMYPIRGAELWKSLHPTAPHGQLLKHVEPSGDPVPSPVMEPQLCTTPLPSWGSSKGSSFAVPLRRFILSCLDFEQTIGCCSLAQAWLETAADLEEGKVNFKSPSCTCVGTCSCVRTDAASFVHVSYSYGSGLWCKINNKKWVGH